MNASRNGGRIPSTRNDARSPSARESAAIPTARRGAGISAAQQSAGAAAASNIGEAARASGVSAKMIRHYEAIGLIPAPARSASGYRRYAESDIHTLRFIRQARDLGFSIKEIAALLSLWQDPSRPSREVRALALEHVAALDQKIAEMQAMRTSLQRLVQSCRGDERPECPILDRLAGEAR